MRDRRTHARAAAPRLTAAAALAASLAVSTAASAHPHMFFDAQAALKLDDAARLTSLEVAFVVDEYNSLFTLAELSLDADGDGVLTASETAKLSRALRKGLADYGYFTELSINGEALPIGAPSSIEAVLADGRIAARLSFSPETPIALAGSEATLLLYDPTFFTAVATLAAPAVVGGGEQCAARLDPYKPSAATAADAQMLAALDREETPETFDIGRRFADRSHIDCAA